jgi:hypothetical protein
VTISDPESTAAETWKYSNKDRQKNDLLCECGRNRIFIRPCGRIGRDNQHILCPQCHRSMTDRHRSGRNCLGLNTQTGVP